MHFLFIPQTTKQYLRIVTIYDFSWRSDIAAHLRIGHEY